VKDESHSGPDQVWAAAKKADFPLSLAVNRAHRAITQTTTRHPKGHYRPDAGLVLGGQDHEIFYAQLLLSQNSSNWHFACSAVMRVVLLQVQRWSNTV